MIKSLIRFSIAVGITGATFLSWGAIKNLKAIALPEAEVSEKLEPIPVFVVADQQNHFLGERRQDEAMVTEVFISLYGAEKYFNELKNKHPGIEEEFRIIQVSLKAIHELAEKKAKDTENTWYFDYVPGELAAAEAEFVCYLYDQQCMGGMDGVPLFVARGGEGNGYLTFEENSQQMIPFFFDKAQLEQMVARFKEQQPGKAADVDIEVYSLEGVMETLETSSDEILEKIVLVPSSESIRFLQGLAAAQTRRSNPPQTSSQQRTRSSSNPNIDSTLMIIEQQSLLDASHGGPFFGF